MVPSFNLKLHAKDLEPVVEVNAEAVDIKQ